MSKQASNGRQRGNGKAHEPCPPHLTPEQATRKAVAAVFSKLGDIIEAMIEKAEGGSHLHAKLLFEFAGISAASLGPEESEQPSLAQVLLQKLDQMAEESTAEDEERPVE